MSTEVSMMQEHGTTSPTVVRHFVLAVLTVMSVLLYLDRFSVGIAAEYIREDLQMTQTQMAWFISAFFWSYALCQVPAGWLSDRYGARLMLTVYILAWSAFTGLIGVAYAPWFMLTLRLFCGTAQAGAYPTSAGLIRQWFPVSFRGTASSLVGLGGRFGAVLAPILTAWMIVGFTSEQDRGWRPTMIIYGIVGILVALIFYYVTRNSPDQHTWCNTAEKSLIQDAVSRVSTTAEPQNQSFPWRAFATSLSLWGNSLTQFLTNIGWFFVVSSLPRYLEEVHGVSLKMQGVMTAFPSAAGVVGLFAGGRCTDWAARRLGLKWGRRFPLVLSRFIAASGYGVCLLMGILVEPGSDKDWLPWLFIAGLCLASIATDFGMPAIWAYAQDVGGRYTASILGWANMWGNIGAATAPLVYNGCLGESPSIHNWNAVFAFCCGAFVLAGLSSMLIDATKSLTISRA